MYHRVFVGRTANRERYFLHISSRNGYPVLISGEVIAYRCREPHGVGQNVYKLLEITEPAAGWTLEELKEIHAVWDKYQLEADVPADVVAKVREWERRLNG